MISVYLLLDYLFLLIFRKYLKQETGEKKVTSVPPLLKERGLGGEAQLQFTHTIRYRPQKRNIKLYTLLTLWLYNE